MKLAGKRRRPAPPAVSGPPTGPIAEPHRLADQPAWVEYAVSKGADRADAEASSKDDLIVVYGSGKRR